MRSRLVQFAATATLVVAPLTACGGGGSTSTSSGPGVNVHAKDTLTFDKSSYEAPAGDVTFTYINDGSIPHTLDIKDKSGFELDVSTHGETKTGTVNLPAGTYTLYCTVAGHEAGGMKATLTVK